MIVDEGDARVNYRVIEIERDDYKMRHACLSLSNRICKLNYWRDALVAVR